MACLEDEMPRFAANLHCLLGYRLFEDALNYVQQQFRSTNDNATATAAPAAAVTDEVVSSASRRAGQFYEALCLLLAGHIERATGYLNRLLDDADFSLPASICTLHIHRDLQCTSSEAVIIIQTCQERVAVKEKSANSVGLFYAAVAVLYCEAGRTPHLTALEYVKKHLAASVQQGTNDRGISSAAGKWLKALILVTSADNISTTATDGASAAGDKTVDDQNLSTSTFSNETVDEAARLFQEVTAKQQYTSKSSSDEPGTASSKNQTGGRHLLAVIGLCECYARRNDSKRLGDTISRIALDLNPNDSVGNNHLLALRLLKVRSFLINHDWESAVEIASDISSDNDAVINDNANNNASASAKSKLKQQLLRNTDNILSELVVTLSHLCYYARIDDFQASIDRLFTLVRTREPKNLRLRTWLVHLLSRLVPTPDFVRKTLNFLSELVLGTDQPATGRELNSTLRQSTASVEQRFELAHQYRLLHETDNAVEVVKEVMRRLQVINNSSAIDDNGEDSDDDVANVYTMMIYTEILFEASDQPQQSPESSKTTQATVNRSMPTRQNNAKLNQKSEIINVPSSSGDGGSDSAAVSKTAEFYFEQAEQQFDFLEQLMLSGGENTTTNAALANSPRYLFLKARMALKKNAMAASSEDDDGSSSHNNSNFVRALSLLNKAAHKHVNMLQNMAFGVEFLYALDAELITAMIRTMLRVVTETGTWQFSSSAPKLNETAASGRNNTQNNYANAVVQQAEHLLEQIYKALPASSAAATSNDIESGRSSTTAGAVMLMPDLQFTMAKVLYMRGGGEGKENQAINLLLRVIEQHPSHEEASLLLARIRSNQRKFKECLTTLESALAHNFALPQRVEYWIIMAQANFGLKNKIAARDNIAKAIRLLDTLPTWPHLTGLKEHHESAVKDFQLVMELLDVCTNCGDILTARNLLAQAKTALGADAQQQLTSGESTSTALQQQLELLTIAEARILISSNSKQADEVLRLLRGLDHESVFHEQARELIGNVLLDMKHDEKSFIELYQNEFRTLTGATTTSSTSGAKTTTIELATRIQAHIMLSNAYMRLPAPERAIQTLEAAVKMDPKNVQLITRLGLLYTRCHYFNKAVNYYELSVKRGNDELLPELVQLLVDMDNYDRARQVVDEFNKRVFSPVSTKEGDTNVDSDEIRSTKKVSVELLVISAKLFAIKSLIFKRANEDWNSAKECLGRAKDEFLHALKRAGRERPDLEPAIIKSFIDISCELCEQYLLREHLFQDAKAVYTEALGVSTPASSGDSAASGSDERIKLGLVRTLIGLRDISQAQRLINTSFGGSGSSTQVQVLTAEIYFHRHDIPQVIAVANSILATTPPARAPDAAVIVTVIDLLFRTGHLPTAMNATLRALDSLAQKFSHYHAQQQEFEAGLSFCRAYLHRLAGNDDAAEQLFKPLLSVPQWAAQAAIQLNFCVLKWNVYMPGFDLTAMQSVSANDEQENTLRPATSASARPKTRGGNVPLAAQQTDESLATSSGNMTTKLTSDEVIILRQMLLKMLPPDLLSLSPTYAVYALLPLVYSTDQRYISEFYNAVSAMREKWPKSVAPMWGVATCLRLFGRDREAHTLLKTTLSLPWNLEEADLLERCWMMLIAESNIFDAAASSLAGGATPPAAAAAVTSILDKCLRFNQNCYFANLLLAQQIERDAVGSGQRPISSKLSVTSREKQREEHREFNGQLQIAMDRYDVAFRVSAGKDTFSGVKLVKAALAMGHAERAMETLVVLMQNNDTGPEEQSGGPQSETNALLYRDLMRNCAETFRT